MCGGSADASAPPVVLCAAAGVGHGIWDAPAPGYSAGMALWAFSGFQGQPRSL
jgi:hypothetical protein